MFSPCTSILVKEFRRKTLLPFTIKLSRNFAVPPLDSGSVQQHGESLPISKVYEIRTYSVKPKYFKSYLKITEERLHLRTKHSKMLGFWSTELGGLNEVIHIWEYDNFEHRTQTRKALANDNAWIDGYYKEATTMWAKQENVATVLVPWSQLTIPQTSGVYELQVFNMSNHIHIWDGRLKAAMEVSSSLMKQDGSLLIGVFYTLFGQHNTVYALWQHNSLDKCVAGKLNVHSEKSKAIWHAFYHEVCSAFSKALVPLQLSPLQ